VVEDNCVGAVSSLFVVVKQVWQNCLHAKFNKNDKILVYLPNSIRLVLTFNGKKINQHYYWEFWDWDHIATTF
jgi:hypothetical protein